jgi:hypothetical protein
MMLQSIGDESSPGKKSKKDEMKLVKINFGNELIPGKQNPTKRKSMALGEVNQLT